jgi:hypothetical protein
MTETPPEPDPAQQQLPANGPDPFVYTGQPRSGVIESDTRNLSGLRILVGVTWAIFAVILIAGGFAEWLSAHNAGGSIVCFVLGAGCTWYDYRVWTRKAKRLTWIA